MSRQTHIFIGGDGPVEAVMSTLELAFDRKFIHEAGSDPYIRLDPVAIYAAGRNEFGDDDITWPDGRPIPLQTQYPRWVEVRDTEKDIRRQEATARRAFEALKATGRWRVILVDDMQKVLDTYQPE